ncbi:FAD-dependent monooxygenase [Pararhodobacter zhoushanensis]|uniref:FAD-dependent monooxygenase n=1 Tax=Pararhodobacter zhoushanensis TaxID=2479545 RepID=A0ABT3GU30_9RHOB|nr:FAD-dependent monooxygenase [Pararhodobacter zhoushanensis]MCW1931049.1 FAD-dependent monooxygenase [Pararhodobacter zhoushanensis]
MTQRHQTSVVIVGAGPVGLSLANELSYRGVDFILVEQGDGKVYFPAGENFFSRTMEHLRRWGIADTLRYGDAFPSNAPRDMGFCTRIGGKALALFEGVSNADAPKRDPQSPEGGFFYPKKAFDPVLRHAVEAKGGDLRYQTRLVSFTQNADHVECLVETADGTRHTLRSRWLAACDGGRSGVRKALGLRFVGTFGEGYNFAVYFRSAGLGDVLSGMFGRPMAQVHTLFDATRAYLTSVDGRDEWRLSIYADTVEDKVPEDVVRAVIGDALPFEVLQAQPWSGHRVVADHYREGRAFLVGDAAHLRWPKGGFGANTGIGDAVDLGWKIAAVEAGWAPEALLDSYETERRPIAIRNTNEAANNRVLDHMLQPDPVLDADGPAGDAARSAMHDRLFALRLREFVTPGIQLGYRYRASPIIVPDGSLEGPDDHMVYIPTTRPGARAPHVALADGQSILDEFGQGFTLVVTDKTARTEGFLQAARALNLPVREVRLDAGSVRAAYETALVLVRPDGHVCWRGDAAPADATAIWRAVSGQDLSTDKEFPL